MKFNFGCPACGATGSADDSLVGRQVRCKHCRHRFAVPGPAEPAEAGGYLLEEPARGVVGGGMMEPNVGAVFVPSRGDEPAVSLSPRKPKPAHRGVGSKRSSHQVSEFDRRPWLIGAGIIAAGGLAATALIAPRGVVIVGTILLGLGMVMVLTGFGAGAFGAFSEDFLYGFFYLVFPLYTAYYLVTRWEDLWKWCLCSTVGFTFVLVGTQLLRWAGVAD